MGICTSKSATGTAQIEHGRLAIMSMIQGGRSASGNADSTACGKLGAEYLHKTALGDRINLVLSTAVERRDGTRCLLLDAVLETVGKRTETEVSDEAWTAAMRTKALFLVFDMGGRGHVCQSDVRDVLGLVLDAAHHHDAASAFLHPECKLCKGHSRPDGDAATPACTCPCGQPSSPASLVLQALESEIMSHGGEHMGPDGERVRAVTPDGLCAWLQVTAERLEQQGLGVPAQGVSLPVVPTQLAVTS